MPARDETDLAWIEFRTVEADGVSRLDHPPEIGVRLGGAICNDCAHPFLIERVVVRFVGAYRARSGTEITLHGDGDLHLAACAITRIRHFEGDLTVNSEASGSDVPEIALEVWAELRFEGKFYRTKTVREQCDVNWTETHEPEA